MAAASEHLFGLGQVNSSRAHGEGGISGNWIFSVERNEVRGTVRSLEG